MDMDNVVWLLKLPGYLAGKLIHKDYNYCSYTHTAVHCKVSGQSTTSIAAIKLPLFEKEVVSIFTCMMRDEVTIGLIPSSIRVPGEREKTIGHISLSLSLQLRSYLCWMPWSLWASRMDLHCLKTLCQRGGSEGRENIIERNNLRNIICNYG